MYKTVAKVNGMVCGMCESHINDAVRREFSVRKVSSSRARCETVIISDEEVDEAKLREVITSAGYEIADVHTEAYAKKGLFGGLFGKN